MYFSYAGRKSTEFGLYNVVVGQSGMLEDLFAPSREIQEVKIKGRDQPYFQSTEKQPIQFNVQFAFEEYWNQDLIREVARWLTEQKYYQPLYFSYGENKNPERIFYAICVGDSSLVHNAIKQGYINLTFRCDGAYAYSPTKMDKIYNWDVGDASAGLSNLSTGQFKNTQYIGGSVQLPLIKKKWSNFSSGTKWIDIVQN